MNLCFSPKFLVAATLATAALGVATVAEARPDVYFSIGLQSGPAWVEQAPVYVQPQPVYVRPQPVYVQPAPVYLRPPVFFSPDEVFERQSWRGYDGRYGWERERAWRRAERRRHEQYDGFRGGDRDHDEHGPYRGHRD
jgi:hypothetical protein